jgi:hypothetical protein
MSAVAPSLYSAGQKFENAGDFFKLSKQSSCPGRRVTSTPSNKNYATTSGDVWYMMMQRSPSPFRNFNEDV